MLREIMKAERAAAEAGSWSDREQPSLSYDASEDEEECMPLVIAKPSHPVDNRHMENDINNHLKPKKKAEESFLSLSTK